LPWEIARRQAKLQFLFMMPLKNLFSLLMALLPAAGMAQGYAVNWHQIPVAAAQARTASIP